ncbi:alpha/beta fold hydrolase [Candidatus Pacearchaeota archaeon]|nr:alpha/beta fold hydrolase [Candidatus Pacearchaeota archaeon]
MVTNYEREDPELLGKVNAPIAVTASYFFDVYKTKEGEEITVPSKTESIDTYAIRLRDIIDTVKYRTGKDKVIIVAHSMGGLVTRRYVQVFGDSNIEKAIFITIPNHGIDGKVRDYCAVFGEKSTCEDMDKNSIFINKLDNSPQPTFPIENIIGIGCNMSSETGDGIVKNSSQFLDFAKNYYVNGACNELGLEFFHEEITDIDKYPKVYEIINKTIRSY